MQFAHLHVHTGYSLLDGLSHIPSLVRQTKALGMQHLAITDHGVMYGALELYLECRNAGIHPVIGMEAYLVDDIHHKPKKNNAYWHLLLLAATQQGYRNLLQLTTLGFTEGLYYGKPRIDKQMLMQHADGLIATSSCLSGEIPELIARRQDMEGARQALRWYLDLFGDRFYLEFQQHYGKGSLQDRCNEGLYALYRETGVPPILTNDLHYVSREQASTHDLFLCIQMNNRYDDPARFRFDSEHYFLKSPQEMAQLLPELPEALTNTVILAERCRVDPTVDKTGLPAFDIPPGFASADDYLYHLCLEGARWRFGEISTRVQEQLDYEFAIIRQKGFASYFLIQQDITTFARSRGITCLARGSAAGSLIAYCLGITNVDPLRYKLLFERFMNPERNDMPDIDMDYPDDRRDEVIAYTIQRYGLQHTAQMITFNTLGAKQSIKDTARALGKPDLGERLSRLIPGGKGSLQAALAEVPELQALYEQNTEARELMTLAQEIEGYPRSTGVHAAGVILSERPLQEIVPLARKDPKDPSSPLVCGYEHKWLEAHLGLIKYDFLSLANLSILREALTFLSRTRGEELLLEQIPVDPTPDPLLSKMRENAFQMLSRGDAIAVFQLESAKMREYLKQLKPTCIEDIMAMVALYRPGPMDSIPDFIACKHGQKKVEYLDPRLQEWLEESYGVIVYQDQVLQIVNNLAGFPWGKVNMFRKALSKKKKEEIEGYKEDFIQGCVQNGMKADAAAKLFDLILPFGGYGFNKAHAASYGVVAYYTAYLKANYPAEYMAAALTTNAGNTKKISLFIAEANKLGVSVLGPDVNASERGFSIENGAIRFGLLAIKGIGESPIQAILQARAEGGPFRSLADFCTRVDVGKGVIEALIKVGAMDSLAARYVLLASVERAMHFGKRERSAKERGLISLFGEMETADISLEFTLSVDAAEIPRKQLLDWEKEFLGCYLSPHPLSFLAHLFRGRVTHSTVELLEEGSALPRTSVVLGGLITSVRHFQTRRGEAMCGFQLEDAEGSIGVIVFPRALNELQEQIEEGRIVMLSGEACYREQRDEVVIQCATIEPVQAVETEMNRQRSLVWFTLHSCPESDSVALSNTLSQVQDLHTCLHNAEKGYDCYEIQVISTEWSVRLTPPDNTFHFTDELRQRLAAIVGEENIYVQPL
uniref:DNA polymerase III subunit alpha n=1 Tax=Thermosporothrix sp. COM3 TaxID=2490863 RepID=A0A455SCG0_9CHLR|nr:DNA-directed DNA polymerase [Thermosporothrix sp. COM3]